MNARLENIGVTVKEPLAVAEALGRIFGWKILWQGVARMGGQAVHVGTDAGFLVVYSHPDVAAAVRGVSYLTPGGLNQIGVRVRDPEQVLRRVLEAGYLPHGSRPGKCPRQPLDDGFRFDGPEGIEIEVRVAPGG